jgi:hypothetical protein
MGTSYSRRSGSLYTGRTRLPGPAAGNFLERRHRPLRFHRGNNYSRNSVGGRARRRMSDAPAKQSRTGAKEQGLRRLALLQDVAGINRINGMFSGLFTG